MASDKDKTDKIEISKNKAILNIQMDIETLADQSEPVQIKYWVDRFHAKNSLLMHLNVLTIDEAERLEEEMLKAKKTAIAKIPK